ncbi:adenosine receptor A2a-like [Girardinichthys multiradiatus]|uniref:adenosine receptor A2a-like n=1 Tax=Girardinichthys multiradiatus TaxID=208333 RepID=UPI001FAE462A|nr:adenosine receptor A2a-like [Girardinichthys multiradiatus]
MVEGQLLCNESAGLHGQTVTSYALNVFAVTLSLLIICGNLLVIVSVIYFKQLHTPSNFLILSLAVADLLVGALVLPFSTILSMRSCLYSSYLLCKMRGLFDMLLCASSILNLCCISIDRYYAVCNPLTYSSKMNVRVTLTMILISWTLSALLSISITVRRKGEETLSWRCKIFIATNESSPGPIFAFYIPTIIILTIYLKILMVAKRQARRIQNTIKSEAALSKMEKKANTTLAIVLGVFLMCWAPYFLSIGLYSMGKFTIPHLVIEAFKWLGWSNSVLNPLVYAFFYRWFRRAFKMIISGKIFQANFSSTKLLLSHAERNYDVGDCELLAIKLALEEWRHWLEGVVHPVLTAQLLVKHVFPLHSIPQEILSDRGPQFTSQLSPSSPDRLAPLIDCHQDQLSVQEEVPKSLDASSKSSFVNNQVASLDEPKEPLRPSSEPNMGTSGTQLSRTKNVKSDALSRIHKKYDSVTSGAEEFILQDSVRLYVTMLDLEREIRDATQNHPPPDSCPGDCLFVPNHLIQKVLEDCPPGPSSKAPLSDRDGGDIGLANQEVETKLRVLCDTDPTKWSHNLLWVEHAIDSVTSSTTGLSAFYISMDSSHWCSPSKKGRPRSRLLMLLP